MRIIAIARVLAKALVEGHVRPWMATVAHAHVHVHAETHAHALHPHTLAHTLAHAGCKTLRHALAAAHGRPIAAGHADVREAAEVALLAAVGGVEEGAGTGPTTAEALCDRSPLFKPTESACTSTKQTRTAGSTWPVSCGMHRLMA